MAPPPLVLLDEEQQRTLQTAAGRVGSAGRSSSNAGLHNMRNSSFGGYPTTPLSDHHRGDPRMMAPKSDFRTDFRIDNRAEPRTNFTSAAMAERQNGRMLHDHVEATGGRVTNMTNGTFNSSSPKTNFTSRRVATDFDPTYPDYTPMMMSDRLSDTRLSDDRDDDGAPGYAGSSSGLRISMTYILIGVALGVGLGIMFSTIKVSELTARWIALPGDLFVRAMKSLVIPYVFCSVAVAIGDIVFVGKVSIVGLQTFKVFVMMWVTTAVLGMSVAMLFRPMFRLDRQFIAAPTNSVGLTCQNGMLLQMQSDSSLMCTGNATTSGISDSAAFELKDTNDVFRKDVKRALALMTVTKQVIAMLNLIVPSNIFLTLSNGDLLSTITFAMVFGAVAGRAYFTKTRRVNYVYLVLLQLRNTFFLAMEWVIWLTPVAVVSIIAGSFATNQDAFKQLGDVYMYVVAVLTAATIQMLVTQPALIFVLTRCNPYRHMSYMTRAYAFAFGVSSSLVTAPVALACVKKARVCSQSLANFVISIGACSNMSVMGIYIPVAIIFLAESSGVGDELTTWRLVAIFLLTLLACAGTPPIPNAGVALMATLYKTVFGVSELPSTFALYIAVDFFVDRISTVCNVNDDIMALKVIAENTDETIVGDHLGERE